MKNDKKAIHRILALSGGFILVTLVIFAFFYESHEATKEVHCTTEPYFFCGTVSPEYSENGLKGRQIFNVNCAACHQKNRRMLGPALARVDSLLLFDWLTDKKAKVDTSLIKAYKKEYHIMMFRHALDSIEVAQISEYCWTE